MKLFDWRAILTNDAEHCKHTHFTCNDCGSQMFKQKKHTKTSMLQTRRLMRRVQKIFTAEELK